MAGVIIVSAYLIGSFPGAWLITKALTGKDLRRIGSGNVGVMNVAYSISRAAGLAVFMMEVAKGLLAIELARALGADVFGLGLAAMAVVIGTRWPVWLQGAGGRGNTAGAAALLATWWPALVIFLGLWVLARAFTNDHFVATRTALLTWPVVLGLLAPSVYLAAFGAAASGVYLTTHSRRTDDHSRIKREWGSFGLFITAPHRSTKPWTLQE
ncbi:MAG TPA: glycerol-3-phosphate acyltransferase [Anaerolineales bacterium]|nr:glycerol-3-phosphate acyltransferase [Anaerolineales bacterium]